MTLQNLYTRTKRLDGLKEVAAIELNISCPNLKNTKLIAQDPNATYAVVNKVRRATEKTLITKLTPNVTDIAEIALAAEAAGSGCGYLWSTLLWYEY